VPLAAESSALESQIDDVVARMFEKYPQ